MNSRTLRLQIATTTTTPPAKPETESLVKISIASIALSLALVLAGCAGTNFNLADAKKVSPGMTTDEVVAAMKTKPYVTEVHGDETHFVWVYADLTGRVKQVKVRFDKNGRVIAAPVAP